MDTLSARVALKDGFLASEDGGVAEKGLVLEILDRD